MDQAGTSPLAEALDRVGDRWSLLIVEALLSGPRRYGELSRMVSGIAPNILVDRLRRLGRAGILVAEPYSTRPPRLAYRLTSEGHDLGGVVRLLAAWGAPGAETRGLPRHGACGSPMEPRWWCATCARAVDDDEGPGLIEV